MRRVREKGAQKRTNAWAEANGVDHTTLTLRGRRGWPDEVYWVPGGRPLLVEFKAEGEEPRKLQLYVHDGLLGKGYDLEVHTDSERAIASLRARVSLWNRFWSKVDRKDPSACWPWVGAKDKSTADGGYGVLGKGGRGAGLVKAHRLAYQYSHGVIDESMEVCHTCNNKACCNPSHLVQGTHAYNMAMAKADGLMGGNEGEANGTSRITEQQAKRLLGPLARGEITKIAAELGISVSHASRIRRGKKWKHLTEGKS